MACNRSKESSNFEKSQINTLQECFEDVSAKKFMDSIFATLEKDPLFHPSEKELTKQMPIQDLRHLTHLRVKRFLEYSFGPAEMSAEDQFLRQYVPIYLGMLVYGWGLTARLDLNAGVSSTQPSIVNTALEVVVIPGDP